LKLPVFVRIAASDDALPFFAFAPSKLCRHDLRPFLRTLKLN